MPLPRALRKQLGRLLRSIPGLGVLLGVSGRYEIISQEAARNTEATGWLRGRTARRQQAAYAALLREMREGQVRIDLQIAVQSIEATGIGGPRILEVGCGNGYYAEVFEHLLGKPFEYVGTDYSAAMIETAAAAYPDYQFEVADASALQYPDAAFDIVFNGVSLMHILDFEKAIEESHRVAKAFCIFHSVPLFDKRETTYLRKYAYGSPVAEIVFNRGELLSIFEKAGLCLVNSWKSIPYDVYPVTQEHSYTETFLLKVAEPETV